MAYHHNTDISYVGRIRQKESLIAMGLAFILLIAMSPIVVVKYNTFYQIVFVVAGLIVFFKSNLVKIIFSHYSSPLLICLVVFTLFYILESDKYGRASMTTYMRGIVLYICGYTLSEKPKHFHLLIFTACIALLAMAHEMRGGFINLDFMHWNRSAFVLLAAKNIGMDVDFSPLEFKEIVTNFVWYISFCGVLLLSLLDSIYKKLRIIAMTILLIILFFCITTLWSAPVIILIFGFFITILIRSRIISIDMPNNNLKLVFIGSTVALITIIIILISMKQFTSYEAQEKAGILEFIFGKFMLGTGTFRELDDVSGTRFSLMLYSIDTFLDYPLSGVGTLFGQSLSGHSAIFDAFAKFGLLGGVAVAIILVYYMRIAARVSRDELTKPWTMAACTGMLAIFFVVSFVNPIFMTANSEGIFFVVAGFVSGRAAHIQRE